MNNELRSQFLLDPNIHFLNHGSFGACPKPVFETYQRWQLELETQPVKFIGRRYVSLMEEARTALGEYVNCAPDEVVCFPNPTTAISMVARSLDLQPGDEILTTDHEYGAMNRLWSFMGKKTGIRYINHPIPLPVTTHEEFVERFWQGVTAKTKVIFLSHITSQTALILPVKQICRRARAAGIFTIIDGAHAPGQIPLDLTDLGADIYTGALHKWLCAPKGSAFLYVRREVQPMLDPLVVSWGYEAEEPSDSQFIDHHEYQGTHDPAAFLTVPAAIEFQKNNEWDQVRIWAHKQAQGVRSEINRITGQAPICPEGEGWFQQMVAMRLPPLDIDILKSRLYDEFKIEIPIYYWGDDIYVRVSIQAYNTKADTDALLHALTILIPEATS